MDDPILRIRQQNEEKARLELEQARHDQEIASLASIDTTVVEVMKNLVEFLDGKITKTEVINQLDTIRTPDVYKVVEAITELGIITESNRIDLTPLKEALLSLGEKLDQLPKSFPEIPSEVSVSNLSDIEIPEQKEIDFSSVIKAINNIKMVAEAPQVTVNTDLDPLKKEITNVVKSINSIKFPEIPKTDLSKVEKKLDVSNRILKDIYEKPVGGGGSGSSWPAVNSEGLAQPLTIDDNGNLLITQQHLTERYDLDNANIIYTATAPVGTADNATGWTITKYDLTDSNDSSGKIATDVSWEDRATGSYA
jgi:hypothetical protein